MESDGVPGEGGRELMEGRGEEEVEEEVEQKRVVRSPREDDGVVSNLGRGAGDGTDGGAVEMEHVDQQGGWRERLMEKGW